MKIFDSNRLGKRISEPKSGIWWVLSISLIWTIEVFLVQEFTLRLDSPLPINSVLKHCIFRFVIDFFAVVSLIVTLPRLGLLSTLIASTLLSVSLITYFQYFDRPLSALTIMAQSSEGIEALKSILAFIPIVPALILISAMGLKILLVVRGPALRLPMSRDAALPCLLLLVISLSLSIYRPIDLRYEKQMPFWGHMYGYTCVWISEILTVDSEALLQKAELAKGVRSEKLNGNLLELKSVNHIAIVQAESLDFDCLHLVENGKRVMPFLSALSSQGFVFAIKPCLLYTSPSPRDRQKSRMPSSA